MVITNAMLSKMWEYLSFWSAQFLVNARNEFILNQFMVFIGQIEDSQEMLLLSRLCKVGEFLTGAVMETFKPEELR